MNAVRSIPKEGYVSPRNGPVFNMERIRSVMGSRGLAPVIRQCQINPVLPEIGCNRFQVLFDPSNTNTWYPVERLEAVKIFFRSAFPEFWARDGKFFPPITFGQCPCCLEKWEREIGKEIDDRKLIGGK